MKQPKFNKGDRVTVVKKGSTASRVNFGSTFEIHAHGYYHSLRDTYHYTKDYKCMGYWEDELELATKLHEVLS